MRLKTAILITCYNRVEKTKLCLRHCFDAISLTKNFDHDIFLLDDNSPDKTGEIIRNLYPTINVIYGNGKYFGVVEQENCGSMPPQKKIMIFMYG